MSAADVSPEFSLGLASEFDPTTRPEWQQAVNDVLRKTGQYADGQPVNAGERELTTALPDGLALLPLYTAEDSVVDRGYPGIDPFTRGSQPLGTRTGWDVRQRHADPDGALTAAAIRTDLENGANSIWLVMGDGAVQLDDLDKVLSGVYLDLAPVVLDAGANFLPTAEAFLEVAAARRVADDDVRANLGADPITTFAASGSAPALDAAAHLASRCVEYYTHVRAITVDASMYHEAGATDVQEVAFATASGLAYLRALEAAGVPLEDAADQIEFRFAATADQFLTIAKFRAARRVWARVTSRCGVRAKGQRQHAVTSHAMMTQRDPWVNMLRATTACFGAGVGGAGAVTVLPFDSALGLPDDFSRRIARNTQSVLIEEAHLARVIDPAGGSWYVDQITEDLAQAAWRQFAEIEAEGGMLSAIETGSISAAVVASRTEHQARTARRDDPITGVSEFPLENETLLVRRPTTVTERPLLPRIRYAAPFELLRDRADAHRAAHGTPPRVALRPVVEDRAHRAVVSFARGVFTLAGFAFAAHDEDRDLLCVCITHADADSAEPVDASGPQVTAALAQSADIYPGCDVAAALSRALDLAGVA